MDYQKIKELAKKSGCSTRDLIVLAPQNDPFYTGTKTPILLTKIMPPYAKIIMPPMLR